MKQIKFYKNNRLTDLKGDDIRFIPDDLIIIKENVDSKVILDFSNKKCHYILKATETELNIQVLKMHYNETVDAHLFEYILVSEPEVENMLIISKN